MTVLANRYDFALFFTVKDGNPNGDPDAGNLPRMDPETGQGLVTDVALKRKIRNYVAVAKGTEPGFRIYVTERSVLNTLHAEAWKATGIEPQKAEDFSRMPTEQADAARLTAWMCENFFDIRTFGAVMTTEINAGQVRGPVQLAFARSVEPITPLELSITRSSVTNERDVNKERTIGRKHIVPFGLYRVHGFINAKLAEKTGFTEDDLDLFWTALRDMFDLDRSAVRGEMAAHRLVAFRHDSSLGNAQAHRLLERISAERLHGEDALPVNDPGSINWPPARAFSDYRITVDDADLPPGIRIVEPW